MKRNLWGLLIAGVLATGGLVATTLTASAASAASTTPTVTATSSGTGMRVSWVFASTAKAKGRVLELQKSTDNGATFAGLLTRTNAPNKANVVDTSVTTRYVTYRARVTENGSSGTWGTSAAIDTYPALPDGTKPCADGSEANAIDYINRLRATINHPPLVADIRLMRATSYRAGKFAARGFASHAGDASDAKKFGFKAAVAENISTGGDWKSTIDSWMSSPAGHRTTLMNGIAVVGIGCAIGSVGVATGIAYWSLLTYYNAGVLFPS